MALPQAPRPKPKNPDPLDQEGVADPHFGELDDIDPLDADDRSEEPLGGDPDEDIDWTPDASSEDAEADDLPIGEHDVFDEAPESLRDRSHLGPPSAKDPAPIEHPDDDDAFEDAERHRPAPGDWDPHAPDANPLALDLADEIDDDESPDTDDGGIEGTNEDIAAEVDESALPDLDADAGAGFEVDDLMRELAASGFGRESNEPAWVLRDGLQRVGAFADVIADGGRVVAVGAELVELGPGDTAFRSVSLPAPARRVALHSSGVIVVSGDELLHVSRGAGSTAPLVLFDAHRPIRSLAIASGRVWTVAGESLWMIASPPATPQRVRDAGARCLASAGDALFLVAVEANAVRLARFHGDDGDWQIVSTWTLDPEAAQRVLLAVSRSGAALAFVDRDTLWHSWDRGATWASLELEGLLAVTHRSTDGRDELLILHRREGCVALASMGAAQLRPVELPCAQPWFEGAVEGGGLAWCDARETLFVATPRGLVAVGPVRTH
ncbi:MAG: hypothetical protein U0414_23585 [Polyangiaceae bacterium]